MQGAKEDLEIVDLSQFLSHQEFEGLFFLVHEVSLILQRIVGTDNIMIGESILKLIHELIVFGKSMARYVQCTLIIEKKERRGNRKEEET